MGNRQVNAVVLAAGKGTRMKSDKAKVLHEIFSAPMVHHVLDAVMPLAPAMTVVVVGHQAQAVQDALAGYNVSFALQEKQLGTGHAVLAARELLAGSESSILILCGDTPLIRTTTLRAMLDAHWQSGAALTVMSTEVNEPTGYGRIVKGADGGVLKIVEEKDATAEQKGIREINAGIYLVESGFLFKALDKVGTDNAQGEMYLTDIVGIAVASGSLARIFCCTNQEETLGVNSRAELAIAHDRLEKRRSPE